MKVAHVISSFHPFVGGAEITTERLCCELRDLGADVRIVTRRKPGTSRIENVHGLPVYRCGLPSLGKLGAFTFGVHAFVVLATSLRACRIIHVQNIDSPLLVGLLASFVLRRQLVATIHAEMNIVNMSRTWLGRRRLRAMVRHVDAFTAISVDLHKQFRLEGIEEARIWDIPNGIDTDIFRPASGKERRSARHELGIPADAVVTVFVGRLVQLKQVDVLLRAWCLLEPTLAAELIIVGDGPEYEPLVRLRDERALGGVRFVGNQPGVRELLRAADIFTLPSRKEGLSVALLEAMGTGLAVIVSDLPGNRGLVGSSGVILECTDDEHLAAALRDLIGSAEKRQSLGQAARSAALRYSLEDVARRHLQFYAALNGSKTRN